MPYERITLSFRLGVLLRPLHTTRYTSGREKRKKNFLFDSAGHVRAFEHLHSRSRLLLPFLFFSFFFLLSFQARLPPSLSLSFSRPCTSCSAMFDLMLSLIGGCGEFTWRIRRWHLIPSNGNVYKASAVKFLVTLDRISFCYPFDTSWPRRSRRVSRTC